MTLRLRSLLAGYLCAAAVATLAPLACAAGVEVSDAWARATPPGATTGAVFFVLRNTGSQDDRLRAVASPVARAAELHTHLMDSGVARMRQLPEIVVPANATVVLKPGGLHVMLFELRQPLKDGESIDLVLGFDKAGERKLQVPVRHGAGH